MNRAIETRLAKLEGKRSPQHLSHEEWVDILNREPAAPGAAASCDAQVEAEALAEFGSLRAATLAARAKAKKSGVLMDAFLASDLEQRAGALSEGVAA